MVRSGSGRTLAEIGQALGVSAMTVSRALNGQPGISDATRRKISDYARKAGYRPNQVARSLASGRTLLLAAVLRSIGHPQTARMVQGIEEEAVGQGYGLLLYITRGELELERRHLEAVSTKRVDGLIVYPTHLRADVPEPNRRTIRSVETMGIRMVTIMRPFHGIRVPSVQPDFAGAAASAAEHLLGLGHRRILYLTITTRTCHDVCEHIAGIGKAMRGAGLRFDPEADVAGDQFGAYEGFVEKIRAGLHSAAICYSDDLAFGAMVALRRRGIEVPRDVSLVGMNDDPIAARCDPALTTVALPFLEAGREAARLLISTQGWEASHDRRMPGRLVVRGSTAAPRSS